ncbi:EAL domain-containing protein [Rhizobium sp. RU36D]|uniref:sensor domain-containing phosphodiesterase n=1 Tax=Rhizobium sp. RU36D TaxID=1907415 RepID=UPI0009D868DA|nr:EAL domain-containing protein [Rhizobium sp. RU36D]SMC68226.1 EAL domain, c-di-GMP-specific phosphodiesterase class I (or its enzymatically inactive variant) [Rhizobium sp. RU36D]
MRFESPLADALLLQSNEAQVADIPDHDIENALKAVRSHLGMEVGFVSEFQGEERIFRRVDSILAKPPLFQGQRLSMDSGYCRKVVSGELPELIPDTSLIPAALGIPETSLLPIGSHISVPIRLTDGSVYGTLCCFSSFPDTSLRTRDLQTMRAVADLLGRQVEQKVAVRRERDTLSDRISGAMARGQPDIVYQPIMRLDGMTRAGCEALSRFSGPPQQGPDRWFADAATVGMRLAMEIAAVRKALEGYKPLWGDGAYLALNLSPQTVIESDLAEVFAGYPLERIVLELTEHEQVEDYEPLMKALAGLRSKGLRIAVDDAGSGYASLRHVLSIRPDIIKLDVSLTRSIDMDPVRQALAAAIVSFGGHVSCQIVAEGIETEQELLTLQGLGVRLGQGYLLARPAPIEALNGAGVSA